MNNVPASRPLEVLMLGGSGFIGPYFVNAAVARGHRVAVFSRGVRAADLPPTVERLTGDRESDLSSIRDRDWDVVIDLVTLGPKWVRTLGQAIRDQVGHYAFISTNDVYDRPSRNAATDESARVLEWNEDLDPGELSLPRPDSPRPDGDYGVLKLLCEREAEVQFPGRNLAIRPGYIVGPGDYQERFTYWVARLARGGHVLAPGDPRQPVQFIDVRDLAEWTIQAIERRLTGAFNVLGPAGSMSLAEMLGGIRAIFSVPTRLTWVELPWIGRQDIVEEDPASWEFWRFSRDDAIDSGKAAAAGLTFRPLAETARWVHDWYASLGDEERTSGPAMRLSFTGEGSLFGGLRGVRIPWHEFLAREAEILDRWSTHRARLT